MMPKVIGLKEGISFTSLDFEDICHIGRKETGNHMVIPDKEIAKRHVTLRKINNRYYIIDRGSPKGIFLDDKRVKAKKINDGEYYKISTIYSLEVEMEQLGISDDDEFEDEDEFSTIIPVQTAKIVVVEGPMAGKKFQLDQDLMIIGRHKCSDVLLQDDDPEIAAGFSRQHAEIRKVEDDFLLDVLSENGIVFEGMRYGEGFEKKLEHNHSFTIGSITFRFENPSKVL
ncbi:FHA domain-containing protein [candidate division CSSED10-310 bacterium]|uniref:FHA domain-containing protein n=1 Tax=candidate division CSSED10-310 bacterium TaxID=2855610 RepID=A0ABV6YW68_UNCC1